MQFTPALPWSQGTGGAITLNNRPVTQEAILAGALTFTYEYNGEQIAATVVEQGGNIVIGTGSGSAIETIFGIIQGFEGESSEIRLVPTSGGEDYALVSVTQAEPGEKLLESPTYVQCDDSRVLAFLDVYGNTVVPTNDGYGIELTGDTGYTTNINPSPAGYGTSEYADPPFLLTETPLEPIKEENYIFKPIEWIWNYYQSTQNGYDYDCQIKIGNLLSDSSIQPSSVSPIYLDTWTQIEE